MSVVWQAHGIATWAPLTANHMWRSAPMSPGRALPRPWPLAIDRGTRGADHVFPTANHYGSNENQQWLYWPTAERGLGLFDVATLLMTSWWPAIGFFFFSERPLQNCQHVHGVLLRLYAPLSAQISRSSVSLPFCWNDWSLMLQQNKWANWIFSPLFTAPQ